MVLDISPRVELCHGLPKAGHVDDYIEYVGEAEASPSFAFSLVNIDASCFHLTNVPVFNWSIFP